MDKIAITKKAVSIVVGFTTAKVVKEIIRNNVAPDKVTDKVAIAIASYILGAIAATAASEWSDAKIDELIEWWGKNVSVKF